HRFYERAEIRDSIAYLTVVNNPDDNVRLFRIINTPGRGIGASTVNRINDLALATGRSAFDIISHSDEFAVLSRSSGKLKLFAEMILRLREGLDEKPVNELFEDVLNETGYIEYLSSDREKGQERKENIGQLLTNLLTYTEENGEDATLQGFLEEVALLTDIDNYNADADAVVMMTLHSAKGLEFPYVFITGMEDGLFPGRSAMYDSAEIEEERRLAYVGITRAKKRLWLLNAAKRMLYGYEQENPPSRFVGEIPESLLENEDDFVDLSRFRTFDDYAVRAYRREAATRRTVDFAFKETAPAEKKTVSFAAGDKVLHPSFGEGKVLTAEKMGNDMLLKIDFGGNIKKIMANYARMKKL
ncbi:MAG: ATP-binding domain-containing protein, partial [Clostridia bacterium]|nr:ATP-binding domain-containing protein [Clostridia bacterium]